MAQPQIPPRNVNWSAKGQWVHLAKVGFEKYFLRKMRTGQSEPFYESFLLRQLDIAKLKQPSGVARSPCPPPLISSARIAATVNRVPVERPADAARCGGCHQALFDAHPVAVDEAGFERHVRANSIPVLLDVWAPWCGPCRTMAPAFEQAAVASWNRRSGCSS